MGWVPIVRPVLCLVLGDGRRRHCRLLDQRDFDGLVQFACRVLNDGAEWSYITDAMQQAQRETMRFECLSDNSDDIIQINSPQSLALALRDSHAFGLSSRILTVRLVDEASATVEVNVQEGGECSEGEDRDVDEQNQSDEFVDSLKSPSREDHTITLRGPSRSSATVDVSGCTLQPAIADGFCGPAPTLGNGVHTMDSTVRSMELANTTAPSEHSFNSVGPRLLEAEEIELQNQSYGKDSAYDNRFVNRQDIAASKNYGHYHSRQPSHPNQQVQGINMPRTGKWIRPKRPFCLPTN